MTLAAGTALGSYQIEAPLGAGGMGEVYKARDTRLGRTVAIKVLPAELSTNERLRERFDREARAISSLNHPHICTLHDVGSEDGVHFLVMEYLKGETLADRLRRGALRLDEALDVARQIARALDAAHRQDVVHRDLKPGNVMLTKSGVKLLDFGLAKTAAPPDNYSSAAPTAQKPLTEKGAVLGTFQYMSPEQLEGGDVGRATDIFAFGAVLYEMVTGEKAFSGKSQASLIAAILEREPKPLGEVKPASPVSLDRLIRSCLRKDPEERWESARDVERELAWIQEPPAEPALGERSKLRAWWLAAALALLGVVAGWLVRTPPSETRQPIHVSVTLPEGQRLRVDEGTPMAVSPDGERLVYVADSDDGSHRLYVRGLSSFETVPIAGTEGGRLPFFSPDGQWVGFLTANELKKVPVAGGPATTLASVRPPGSEADWGDDGFIYFNEASSQGSRLLRVPESGGPPESLSRPLVTPPTTPQLLPGGRSVLVHGNASTGGVDVGVLTIGTKDIREIQLPLDGAEGVVFVPPQYLLMGAEGSEVLAARFDPKEYLVTSEPAPVVGMPVMQQLGRPIARSSANGVLAFVSGAEETRYLVEVDRRGASTTLIEAWGHAPRISPDGRRLAFDDSNDVWVFDLEREALSRVTTDRVSTMAAWTSDGARLAFGSTSEDGAQNVSWTRWDGSEARSLLTSGEYPLVVESISGNGRYVALTESHTELGLNVVILDTSDDARIELAATRAKEHAAQLSPDGRFVAYVSDESGISEVYVRPFPEGSGRWQVSTRGGAEAVWSHDGTELFYRQGTAMMSVPVELSAAEPFGRPVLLFDNGDYLVDNSGHPGYSVSPDGEAFYMTEIRYGESLTQIHLVLNFLDELERLLPSE